MTIRIGALVLKFHRHVYRAFAGKMSCTVCGHRKGSFITLHH